ncbi:MAG: DUF5362 family protein [Flavisolibacter sp.]
MDQEQSTELFSLQIDSMTKTHLAETARWGRFLAIVGFIMCGLIVLGGIAFGSFFSMVARGNDGYDRGVFTTALGTAMVFVYIIVAVVYFFPCLFLFRFSAGMKKALNSNSQDELDLAFQNLKSMFKYVGVITIIFLALYALGVIIAMFASAAFH